MAVFEFNDGPAVSDGNLTTGATSAAITFSETSEDTLETVTFSLSTSLNPPGNKVSYAPGTGDGQLTLSEFGSVGSITLSIPGTSLQGSGLQLEIGSLIDGIWFVDFVNPVGPHEGAFANAPGQVINLGTTNTDAYSKIRFTPFGPGNVRLSIDSLTVTLVCYLEGTRIATPEGDKPVEDLRPGDVVLTADGGETTVQWLGEQPVETALSHPAKVNPIRIRAGALAENVPARDLLVSPDHAIGIEGYLVNASALVNGSTVTREAHMPAQFTYYHVETGRHELLLAEGCAAESYVDFVTREGFVNGAERLDAPAIPEMAVPRISAARHLPPKIRAALAARAEALAVTRAA